MRRSRTPVALVTGGGRRLGRQICLALGHAGFDVAVNYHNSAAGARTVVKDLNAMGQRAGSFKANVSKSRQVDRMVSSVIRTFGRIDLLVNNAAVFLDSPARSTTESTWDTTIDINLKGIQENECSGR